MDPNEKKVSTQPAAADVDVGSAADVDEIKIGRAHV